MSDFLYLKINKMMPFCNLFVGRPSILMNAENEYTGIRLLIFDSDTKNLCHFILLKMVLEIIGNTFSDIFRLCKVCEILGLPCSQQLLVTVSYRPTVV